MGDILDETIPMGYEELCEATNRLKRKYRSVQCFSIGRSVLGRKIIAYMLGAGGSPVLYVGAHHALEYLTSMALVKFTGALCEAAESGQTLCGSDVRKLLLTHCVYIIPMLNPDGVELHLHGSSTAGALREKLGRIANGDFSQWQANARGVDLNHNYNAGFKQLRQMEIEKGITGPAPRQFGGYRPESEPETHALCNLCRRLLFHRVYAFHSQGEEIYWEYGEKTPKNGYRLALALAESCGYTVASPEGLASHGGFKDWYICVFSRPGFTVEIGKGKNPLPPSELASVYEKLQHLLTLGLTL
jgi:g-D-glutamyl-meso-diaminopimelate peptidase